MTGTFLPKKQPLQARQAALLKGELRVPGDKSLSHRALMLGGVAAGITKISGLLEGEDVLHTAAAMERLGADITKTSNGSWTVRGTGGKLKACQEVLDFGNSGTGARLMMGLLASHPFISKFDGDTSLRKRPMARVMDPLVAMGATFYSRDGGRLPVSMIGAQRAMPTTYTLPVASAQVKSAILLAALNTTGTTTVIEPHPTRDHTENMLRHFGVTVTIAPASAGGEAISITGPVKLQAAPIIIPSDPSSAAFPLVAATLVPGSHITLPAVGMNPRRTGLFTTLQEMGADLKFSNQRIEGGEPVADIAVRASQLKGIMVPAGRAPSMIDEFPILAVAAACAQGVTRMHGLGELRVKESDRLAMIAQNLKLCGAEVAIEGDDLIVSGTGQPPRGPARDTPIVTAMDHRIAMSFLVLGCVTKNAVTIDDGGFINTSFPKFTELMNQLGCVIENT